MTASSSGPPTTSQIWYAALGVDVCGTMEPNLPASTNSSEVGLIANGNGTITISPKDSSESGSNATLGKFVAGYKGLQLDSSTLQYPGGRLWTNGTVCPKGTPDSGKSGMVIVASWPNSFVKKGSETSGPPDDLLFQNGQLITMAFVPATASIPKPPASAVTALIQSLTGTSSTPTTSAPAGISGNTSTSAITTSADCPANFSAPLNKPSYSSYPPMTIDTSDKYTATITTDIGSFTIQLDPLTAPQAVNSFVFLAKQHFFDCIIFHRVIPSFVDQTGDPTGKGTGGPGYQFADELPASTTPQYPLGSVAMANSGPNTNGSQFFIVAGSEGESLQPNYSLFGQVISGMNVVQQINAGGSTSGTPTTLHRIISVSIQTG